ncbi:MAG: hypothetical protein V2J62_02235 [candidate division KSB1 bacterium]|jgi:hypothetical protein|nr:hypothetical protein [candidate division KSB1 bacterium]
MMKIICILLTLCVSLSCGLLDPRGSSRIDTPTDQIIMFTDIDDLSLKLDAAAIDSAAVVADSLILFVAYGGGCKIHQFLLYGSSAILKSNPPQAEIYLSHDADNDLCEAYIHERLSFDLQPLKRSYQKQFSNNGPLLLRLVPPGVDAPYMPMPVYAF